MKPHFFFGQIDDAQRNGQFVHNYIVLIRMYRLSALKFIAIPTAIAAATTPAPKNFQFIQLPPVPMIRSTELLWELPEPQAGLTRWFRNPLNRSFPVRTRRCERC